jgi:hypothetical protein
MEQPPVFRLIASVADAGHKAEAFLFGHQTVKSPGTGIELMGE